MNEQKRKLYIYIQNKIKVIPVICHWGKKGGENQITATKSQPQGLISFGLQEKKISLPFLPLDQRFREVSARDPGGPGNGRTPISPLCQEESFSLSAAAMWWQKKAVDRYEEVF